MNSNRFSNFAAFCMSLAILSFSACEDTDAPTDPTDTTTVVNDDVPAVYQKIYGATTLSIDGEYVVIECKGLPDHGSPYYEGTEWADDLYESYNGTNQAWNQNPNAISEKNYTFYLPLNPAEDPGHASTPLGPIGVSLNGVPFFNQYAAGMAPLTGEVNSFDQHNGHPTGTNAYHYHIEPTYLTATQGEEVLLGFLLDGFPVYGPSENGQLVNNDDLDAYHGHSHATTDYPNGIYHYHITSTDPYINGSGYYGTAGTVVQ